jgi:hypothetical protein
MSPSPASAVRSSPPPHFHIDTPFSIANGGGEGLIDFTGVPTVVVGSSASLGILKAFETTTPAGGGLGVNLIVDTDLTFSGSGTVTIGMEAVGKGAVKFPTTSGVSAATFQTLVQGFGTESGSPPGPPFKFGSSGVTTGDPAACLPIACVAALSGQVVPFDSTNFFTESVTNGESQLWSFQLELFMGPQTDLEFFHSADLVFNLPPGVSVHSDLGFTVIGSAAPIPEPSSLLLLSGALVALVGMHRLLGSRCRVKRPPSEYFRRNLWFSTQPRIARCIEADYTCAPRRSFRFLSNCAMAAGSAPNSARCPSIVWIGRNSASGISRHSA